ncbi:putative uncharacterized protein DDB_G0271606 [Lucilia sericata]|uniref:putative uncharacterized protein DDB_G0271606 n=1 Tax=Lucilia sericata TaxID=13632 RepID=UPI0018A82BE8|nr:putative uncharacterized protein DDB_G0271606 [Lucilia sericata]
MCKSEVSIMLLLLILFVSTVLADEKIAKVDDKKVDAKKDVKKSVEETKVKLEKEIHLIKQPMLNSPAPFEAAASATQQVYYDKNQVTPGEGAGNAKSNTNSQAANAYRAQYSQVAHQQQQQQQNKNHIRVAAKNPLQQQQIQLQAPVSLPAQQRGQQQKQIQYVLAIPLSYLRQIQQQLIHQQQQEQPTHLQVYKGQQQPQQQQQQQQQIQAIPVYSIAGPLARDHNGAYRPFHRFAPTAVNDVSTGAQHQTASALPNTQPLAPASPAPPGYITQYIQIPASALLAAVQSAQVQQQQQQRPVHLPQNVYQQQQPQLQLQPPIHQQHVQAQAPQLIYYQPQQQQQLKQPSHALTSPPVYGYNVNQLQQPTQQHQTYEHLTEQQQQNVGKQQPHRVRGVRPTVNLTPSQYDTNAAAYEHEEKAQLVALQAPSTHQNLNTHSHTNAHSQQYIAQAPLAQQQQQQQTAPAHQVVQAPEAFDHVVHYNPQYVQHFQEQAQQQQRQPQHQPHRLHIQPQHAPLVEHLNNLPFSQGIHGPTPLPFLRLHPAAGVTPFFPPGIAQPFVSSGFQPPFTPIGMPSKVTSFTNVLLQPFVGHPSSFHTPEIGTAVAGSADSLPFIHQNGGIRYGTHLYHPPTSATSVLAGNKQHNSAAAHPAPRVLSTTGEGKVSASSAKATVVAGAAVAGSPTVVKYP